jgi:excisionase family DNA binding protein
LLLAFCLQGEDTMDGMDTLKHEPLLLTIPQVMKTLRLGRTMIYQLIDKEGLPVLHFGRAVRVSYAALQEWIKQRDGKKRES